MAEYDGSIRIQALIETGKANSQLMTLEKNLNRAEQKAQKARDALQEFTTAPPAKTKEYVALEKELEKAEAALARLVEKETEMEANGKTWGKDWEKLIEKEIQAGSKIDAINEKIHAMEDAGTDRKRQPKTDEYVALEEELKKTEAELDRLVKKEAELEKSGKDHGKNWDDLVEKETLAGEKIDELHEKMRAMKEAGTDRRKVEDSDEWKKLAEGIRQAEEEVAIYKQKEAEALKKMDAKAPLTGIKAAAKTMADFGKQALSSLGHVVGAGAKKGLGAIRSFAAGAVSHLRKTTKPVDTVGKKITGLIKRVFLFSALTKALRAIRGGLSDSFAAWQKYDETMSHAVTDMQNALRVLQNGIVSAFMPIVEIAVPILTQLLTKMSEITDKAGEMISALAGKSVYKKLTTQMKAYGQATDKTAGKLAAFDQINVLGTDQKASGIEEKEISDEVKELADTLKAGDVEKAAKNVADNVAKLLNKIPWDKIKGKARDLGDYLASFLNGITSSKDLAEALGNTLAEALNTALNFALGFLRKFDFKQFGEWLGTIWNKIIKAVDWKAAGEVIYLAVKGIGDAIVAFVDTVKETAPELGEALSELLEGLTKAFADIDYVKLGQDLAAIFMGVIENVNWSDILANIIKGVQGLLSGLKEFLNGINWYEVMQGIIDVLKEQDWGGLAESLADCVGASIAALLKLIAGAVVKAFEGIGDYLKEEADKAGDLAILGFLDGMLKLVSGRALLDWVLEHVATPLIESFFESFGLGTENGGLAEAGRQLMDSFLGGMKSIWEDIVTWISEKTKWIRDKFGGLLDLVGGFRSNDMAGADVNSYPHLATGAVIRGGNPYAAIVGDQPAGQTNIETPLDTMIEAFETALARNGNSGRGSQTVVLEIDGRELARATLNDYNDETNRRFGTRLVTA